MRSLPCERVPIRRLCQACRGRFLAAFAAAIVLCTANAACGSTVTPTAPYSAREVIAAFKAHGLAVEIFGRATSCGKGGPCTTPSGIPLAVAELQDAVRGRAFVYVVLVYRTRADADLVEERILRSGKFDIFGAKVGFLQRGNVLVQYEADTSRLKPAYRPLFKAVSPAHLSAMRAALASLPNR